MRIIYRRILKLHLKNFPFLLKSFPAGERVKQYYRFISFQQQFSLLYSLTCMYITKETFLLFIKSSVFFILCQLNFGIVPSCLIPLPFNISIPSPLHLSTVLSKEWVRRKARGREYSEKSHICTYIWRERTQNYKEL